MERLLVPLDGSPLAEAVLPVAEFLGRQRGSLVDLVRVVGPEVPLAAQDVAREEAGAYLEQVASRLRARGSADVHWAVWDGDPVQVILNAAVRDRATLILMGTHGRRGFDRLRFGSVAESVARRTPVPALLMGSGAAWEQSPGAGILVPLDGSPRSEAILPVVVRLAVPSRLGVTLVHAVEPTSAVGPPGAVTIDEPTRGIADAEGYLRDVAAGLGRRGLAVTWSVRAGSPADVIEQTARDCAPTLIAMSTHGRTGLGRLLLGSVAEHVARTAAVPVLLWRAPVSAAPAPG